MPEPIVTISPGNLALFAFGFGNALLLGWLAAAALPIIIHLWNKRKYREVPWAAMEYLLAAIRKNSRRIRIEQWLLLAVRTLIILLVVLAMAEPYLERIGLNFVAGTRTLKVFVIDSSYSMAFQPGDQTRFQRATTLVRDIVEDSPQGDGFTLVRMSSPPSTIVSKPAMEKREFYEELQNLQLAHTGGDLMATIIQVEEILQNAEKSGLGQAEVYFLTDLGRTSWSPEHLGPDFNARTASLAKKASLVVLDLGQGSSENLAITDLQVTEPYVTIHREATIRGQIRNLGSQAKLRHLVELYVDGRRVNNTLVDCKPGEAVAATFQHRFDTAGDHLVEMKLGPDLLEIDNHRWLSLPVKQQLNVLCVDGKPAGDGVSGAADYVFLALNPNAGDPSSRSAIRADIVTESALVERDLSQFDAVFLCNVGQFTASEARVLASYVKNGGGLILFLGDRTQAERYNRELGSRGVGLLPAEIGKVVSEAQYRFDPLDYRHRLVTPFKGREQAGLLTTPVYRYFQLTPLEDSRDRIALAFAAGDPAILERSFGRGRVVLMATDGSLSSVDPVTKAPWTTMAAWPSFVPLVQEMLALVAGSQLAAQNVQVGEPLEESLRSVGSKQALKIKTPGGHEESLRLTTDEAGRRWTFVDTEISGPYQIERAGSGNSTNPPQDTVYAVNLDTRESNLARIDAVDLPPQFMTTAPASEDEGSHGGISRRSGLHRSLLYGALALLFFEVFLAWRAGHGRA